MIGLWDLSKSRINHAWISIAILTTCILGEVESSYRWNHHHPLEISSSAVSDGRYERAVYQPTLCRGGSEDRPLESLNDEAQPFPWKKVFRKKRGKLNINFGKPEEKDLASSADDEHISLKQLLPWTSSKAPSANNTSQMNVKEDLNNDAEVKVSMDVFAVLRLTQHLGAACQLAFAAGSATLKMLGPMIMVQQVFERVMIRLIGYNKYNDHKVIEKPAEPTKTFGILVEGLRAAGRVLFRFCGMYLFGILFATVLSASPCAMPEQLCKYWYGLVWTIGVKFVAHANELLFTQHFGLFKMRPEKHYFPLLPPTRLFRIPSPTVRWMYLFFGVVDNVLKVYSDEDAMSSQVIGPLFPSTWPPLQILNMVAMVHTMKQSLPENPRALLIGFCLQIAVYEEWFRVFLEERRALLGAVMSLASFVTTTYFIYTTSVIDRLAAGLLLPFALASVITTWMNFVLCGREFAPTKRRRSPRYMRIE